MLALLCRNRVADFERWKSVFASHAEAHRSAGLLLQGVWRERDRANEVFFLFEVRDPAKAREFIRAPEAAAAGRSSGVLEGEYHFLDSAPGY